MEIKLQGKRKFRDEIKKCSDVCFIDMIVRVLIRFFWVRGELELKSQGNLRHQIIRYCS